MTIDIRHKVMVAWGADVREDPSTWAWSEIHEDVEWTPEYTIKDGRSEGATQAETLSVSPAIEVRNPRGDYTPEDARSSLWPNVVEGTPLWWTVNTGAGDYDLVQGFVSGLTPRWSARNGRHKVVDVAVMGRLGLLSRGARPLAPAYRRAVEASAPLAFWELTDGRDATEFASGLPGGTPFRSATGLIQPPSSVAGPAGAPGSSPAVVQSGAYTGAMVAPVVGGSASEWTIAGLAYVKAAAGNTFQCSAHVTRWRTSGTIGPGTWTVSADQDSNGDRYIFVLIYDSAGVPTDFLSEFVADADTSGWIPWRVSCRQVGGNAHVELWINGTLSDTEDISGTAGAITGVQAGVNPGDPLTADPNLAGQVIEAASAAGIVVYNTATPGPGDLGAAALGFTGETPSQRLVRIGAEAGFPVSVDRGATDVLDEFADRTSAANWGTAPGGLAYTDAGSGGSVLPADWTVSGGAGIHSVPTTSAFRFSYLGVNLGDVEVYAEVSVAAPTGGNLEPTIMLRGKSTVDYYMARVTLVPGGEVQAQLRKIIGNSDTSIETVIVPDLTYSAATPLKIRAQIIGTRYRMKVWQGGTEPAGWHATDTDTALIGPGFAGVRSGVGAGNSNTKPVLFSWLTLEITDLSVRMGPQPAAKVTEIMQECERTGLGRLSERAWGVHYRPLNTLYNQTPALELDVEQGHLGDPFAPKRDLTIIRNKVEVSRANGGRAVWEDTESQSRGTFEDSATINSDSDVVVVGQAQARVGIGTVDGYRYPSLSTDLGRHDELALAWQALQLGDRVRVHGARQRFEHAEDLVDQLVEGRSQTLRGRRSWKVTMVTSPAAPYTVGVIQGTGGDTSPPWRLDATAEITQGYGAGASPLSVTTTGALLSTSSSDYPCDVTVDGVPMRITAVSGASSPQTVSVTRGIDGWDRPLKPPSAGAGRGRLKLWRAARTAL